MANQTKNYRKFVATSVTAALVASAVAPAAFAAEKVDFKDSIPTWAKDAVDYLVGKEAISGYPDGTFNQAGKLTRAEAAKILALSLDLKIDEDAKTDFADAKDHWASSYIAAIQKEKPGVIDGYNGKFDPNANITRQQMAKMVVVAYDLKLDEAADISFSDNTGWGADQVNILASLGVVEGVSAGKFSPNADVTRGQAAVFVHRTEVESVRVAVPSKEAKVVSVNVVNGTQLLVKFSQEVDEDNLGTYTLSDGKVASPELQADGKSVLLTLATAYDNTKAHVVAVTVEDVVVAGTENTFPIFTSVVSVEDKVAAGVAEVKSVTKGATADTAVINFTEPVKEGLIKLNGSSYQITGYLDGAESVDSIELTGLSLDVSKEHTLEVVNLKDAAGNVVALTSKQFKVTKDDVAPIISTVEAYGDYKVLVTFSKKIKADTVAAGDVRVVDELLTQLDVDTFEALAGDSTGTKFVVTLDKDDTDVSGLYTNKNSRTLSLVFADKSVNDTLGNQLAATTKSVTLTKDATAPSVTGITYKKNASKEVDTITVTFDENIADVVDNTFLSKFTIVNASGVQKNGILNGASVEVSGKTAVIDIANVALTGKHSFQIAAGAAKDLALNANNSKAYSGTVDFGAAPTASGTFELAANAINDDTENVVKVTFPKAVKGGVVAGSATDVNNYSVNGKALPAGTTITFEDDDQDVAIIEFAEGFTTNDTNAVFTVNNVQLLTGEVIKPFTTTIKVYDNVAPVLESIRILDANTIELTYSEALAAISSADALDELEVYEGTSKKALTSAVANNVNGFNKKVVVELSDNLDLTKEISVKTVVSSTDLDIAISDNNNGNKHKAGVTVK